MAFALRTRWADRRTPTLETCCSAELNHEWRRFVELVRVPSTASFPVASESKALPLRINVGLELEPFPPVFFLFEDGEGPHLQRVDCLPIFRMLAIFVLETGTRPGGLRPTCSAAWR